MALSFSARVTRRLLRTLVKSRSASVQQRRSQEANSARYLHRERPGVVVRPWDCGSVTGWQAVPDVVRDPTPLVHLHGGGYVLGGIDSHQTLVQLLALALGRTVILPDYRHAPEAPFPAALDDVLDVARALGNQPWLLSGDSAGGGLALALAQTLRDRGKPGPQALVLLSPWTDLLNSGDSHLTRADDEVLLTTATLDAWAELYAQGQDRSNPGLSPLFGRLEGLPPILIQVGSHEILLDDSVRLAARLEAQGGPVTLSVWDGLWHVWPILGDLIPETARALEEIVRFVDDQHPPT